MQAGVELQNFTNVGVRRIETSRYKDSDRRVGAAHGPVMMLRGRGLRPRGVLANDRHKDGEIARDCPERRRPGVQCRLLGSPKRKRALAIHRNLRLAVGPTHRLKKTVKLSDRSSR